MKVSTDDSRPSGAVAQACPWKRHSNETVKRPSSSARVSRGQRASPRPLWASDQCFTAGGRVSAKDTRAPATGRPSLSST